MCCSLVHFPFEVDLRREVKAHELKVPSEALNLFLLLLFEHGDRISLNFCLENELIAILLVFLVPRVLQHGLSGLLIDQTTLNAINRTELSGTHNLYYYYND